MLFERTKIIPGEVSYTNIAQILNSKYLRELIIELINDAEESHSSFQSFFQLFLKTQKKQTLLKSTILNKLFNYYSYLS